MLPCRAQRFRSGPSLASRFSARLAYALHNGVHVVGSYVRSQQIPTAVPAVSPDSRQYGCPARFVEHIGLLEHFPTFCHDAL